MVDFSGVSGIGRAGVDLSEDLALQSSGLDEKSDFASPTQLHAVLNTALNGTPSEQGQALGQIDALHAGDRKATDTMVADFAIGAKPAAAGATKITSENAQLRDKWLSETPRQRLANPQFHNAEAMREHAAQLITVGDHKVYGLLGYPPSAQIRGQIVGKLDGVIADKIAHGTKFDAPDKHLNDAITWAAQLATDDRTKQAMSYFQNQGWSREQAAGIVGNLLRESHIDPGSVQNNGSGPGYGIAQWDNKYKREDDFKKQNKDQDIHQSTFEQQLKFVQHELTSGYYGKHAGNPLHSQTTVNRATALIEQNYEKAGVSELGERQNFAQHAFNIAK